MQGCTDTIRHRVTRKKKEKEQKHIGKLIRKNPKIKDAY